MIFEGYLNDNLYLYTMQTVRFKDLGLVDYKETWDYQESLLNEVVAEKLRNRELPENKKLTPSHHLLFCEHHHVYTLGKSGSPDHLLINSTRLAENNAVFYKINRGGDITYHGPGQLVGYPIFDLDYFFNDIHKYLRYLEEAVILTLKEYDIPGERISGLTGVWLDKDSPHARKICAMGVRCSRWVTMHGFAFNVNTDLSYFNHIVPCGIQDKQVTSLSNELKKVVPLNEVKDLLKSKLEEVFHIKLVNETPLFNR